MVRSLQNRDSRLAARDGASVALLESQGATEIAYQPAGPEIARELETFATAVRG